MAIQLVVGLGNPGQKYAGTRHNIGFDVLDLMVREMGGAFANHLKWRAHIVKRGSAFLMKPQTFMNESGISVGKALRFHKWKPEQVLVVYDDVSIDLGLLRFRNKGSAGGHNGMKSIIQHLGTDEFPRLKIGIGGSKPGGMVGHVLGKFSIDETQVVENTLVTSSKAVQVALSQGVAQAANQYNVKNNT